jgi:preprotein translocase subunit SecD
VNRLRFRLVSLCAAILLFSWWAAASFIPKETRLASPLLPDEGLRLGLDLQGGIHWVLGPDLAVAETHELEFQAKAIQQLAEEKGFGVDAVRVEDGRVVATGIHADGQRAVQEWAGDHGGLRVVSEQSDRIEIGLASAWRDEVRNRGMLQVLEVLRRRIEDPVTGIPESVVARQGDDRILVQIPGGKVERERAGDLLEVTGFLEFKIVRDTAPTQELLEDKHPSGLPADTEIVFERDKETNRVLNAYLVSTTPDLTGEYLTDARVAFDRQGRPIVSFTFNAEGGRVFGDLTARSIGQPLAIILDERVYSAPVIRSQISMRGQIEGRFTPEEAADLAVVLRSGSLPIPVRIEEERTIGPALGADSIQHGIQASVASLIAVLVFAVIYYRLSGVYATIAITTGMVMMIGMMGMFQATLTMPGIAGLVLTVGMAIDGNVLIFERIREELRSGKVPRAAIKAGFSRALLPILDGNITTMITALVLYEYGTGPIKGFAVTLAIGLLATMFQAVVVTRMLFAIYPGDRPVTELSI